MFCLLSSSLCNKELRVLSDQNTNLDSGFSKKKAMAATTTEESVKKKEGYNLLGSPTFKEIENGRFKCVETGHEVLSKDIPFYSNSKKCRLGLIDFALSNNKSPLNMFNQDPLCR